MDTPKSLFMLLSGGVLMAHKRYDRDFKVEAIRLASKSGVKVSAVERRLDISNGIISRWKRQLREDEDDASPGTGHVRPSEIEVRELRRENDRLRQERDIFKKSTRHLLGEGTVARYRFIDEHRTPWSVKEMYRVLEVSRSRFYT
jgi:transposase